MSDGTVGLGRALRMVLDLLGPQGRREAAWLVAAMAVNAATELVGVASLMPLLAVAADPALIGTHPWLHAAYDALGFASSRAFLVFLGVMFLVLFLVANAWNAFTYWLFFRFSTRMSHRISGGLLERFLHRPYAWFLKHSSVDLTRTVTEEADRLVEQVILTAATMLNRAMAAACLAVGLLVLDPMVAIAVTATLSLLYSQIYRVFDRRVDALGKARLALNGERYRRVMEGLGAVKEARCSRARADFLQRFLGPSAAYCGLVARMRIIGKMPGYLTESLAMVAIIGMFLALVLRAQAPLLVFPVMGLYVMATWRLVPMLQNVYGDLVEIQFYVPLLARIHEEMGRPLGVASAAGGPDRLELERCIRLRGVTFTYAEASSPAIVDATVEIARNTTVAFVGRTGCGKTTLADLVSGYLVPDAGVLEVDDRVLTGADLDRWQRNIGYVPQDVFLIDDSVRRNVAFGVPDDAVDEVALERACRAAHVHEFVVSGMEKGYDTVLGERGICLSGGQRQRIGIARALYHDPQVLILDEATNALDMATESAVLQAVAELAHEKTIIVIAHRPTTVRDCDAAWRIDAGRVSLEEPRDDLLEPQDRAS